MNAAEFGPIHPKLLLGMGGVVVFPKSESIPACTPSDCAVNPAVEVIPAAVNGCVGSTGPSQSAATVHPAALLQL